MTCKECGTENKEDVVFCKKCGSSLLPEHICKKCGTENDIDATFCEQCGDNLREDKASTSEKTAYTTHSLVDVQARKKKMGIALCLSSLAIILIALMSIFVVRPLMLRSQVDSYLEKMQYTKAQATYEKLPEQMQDTTEYLTISLMADLENGNYVAATAKLVRLGGYDDAAELIDKSDMIINMIKGSGVTLPSGQADIIGNIINSIAEDFESKKNAENSSVTESDSASSESEPVEEHYDPSLIGTWLKSAIYNNEGRRSEINYASWSSEGIADRRETKSFSPDGTFEWTIYICDNMDDYQYLQELGWVLGEETIFGNGVRANLATYSGEWQTEGGNKLTMPNTNHKNTEETTYSYVIKENTFTLYKNGKPYEQYERR